MGNFISSAFEWVIDTGAELLTNVGFEEATAEAISEFAVQAAVSLAASAAVAAVTAPKIGAEGRPTSVRWSPDIGMPYIMGRRASAGVRTMMDEYGADNRFMSDVRVFSGYGPAKSIGGTTVNQIVTAFDGNGEPTTGSSFRGILYRTTQLGVQPEVGHLTQTGLHGNAQMSNWGSAYKLSGKVAAIYTRYENSKNSGWPTGAPDYLEIIENGLCWDARLDSSYPGGSGPQRWGQPSTYDYSRNGGVQALNFARGLYENGELVEGLGLDLDDIHVDSLIEVANIADLNGWTCDAIWTSRDDKREVFKGMLQAAGARVAFINGKLGAVSHGAQKVSLTTITGADTAGPISMKAFGSRLGRKNTITPRCALESHKWEMIALYPVTNATWLSEDGGETRQTGLDFPFVTDAQQAGELTVYSCANSREGIAASIPLRPYHLDLDPGDCFTINEPEYNIAGIKVQVLERDVDPNTGVAVLQVISETDDKHLLAQGQITVAPAAAALVEAQPLPIDPPAEDFTATPVKNPVQDGTTRPGVSVTGVVASVAVTNYRSDVRVALPDGAGGFLGWSSWRTYGEYPASTTEFFIEGVPSGAKVEPRLTYIDKFGRESATPRSLGEHVVPALVAGGTVVVGDPAGVSEPADQLIGRVDDNETEIAGGIAAINTATGAAKTTLAEALGFVSETAEIGLQDSLLNWLADPANPDGWEIASGHTTRTAGDFTARWGFDAAGVQSTLIAWFPDMKPVRPGVLVEASASVTASGQVAEAILEAVWYDAAQAVLSVEEMDRLASGRVQDIVTAPTGAAFVRFRLTPNVSAAGAGAIKITDPLSAYCAAEQTTPTPFTEPTSQFRSRIDELGRTLGGMASSVRQLKSESLSGFSQIRETMVTTAALTAQFAAYDLGIQTQLTDYLTSAAANVLYYSRSETDNAIAASETTLQASIDGVSSSVAVNAGAIAAIEGNAAYYEIEIAAGGGNPAIFSMKAGKDGASIALGGDALYFTNTVGGASVKAMEIVAGDVRVTNDLYADNAIILQAAGKIEQAFGAGGRLTVGDLGATRKGMEILDAAGAEAFYVDDTGAFRLNAGGLPYDRVGVAPVTPRPGHTWYDTSTNTLKRWNDTGWDDLGTVGATWGGDVSGVPANLAALVGTEGIQNIDLSITANGALVGGGGGEVTIAGLGYVGDLNATAGASWGANLTGRPVELIDGRILAGLDTNGDVVRAIKVAVADSSNLLRRATGGVFTGALDANNVTNTTQLTDGANLGGTASWAGVSARPANVAALTGTEDIRNSLVSLASLGYTGDLNANNVTNTNQLTDGANLGGTASWAGTTGRPANIAALTGTEDILNSAVSLATLGYTGDTNATAGADWATNVAGRPPELSDGRVAAALNASGVLQTNIANTQVTGLGGLATRNDVETAQIATSAVSTEKIAANAVTNASSNSADEEQLGTGVIADEYELVRTTITLTAGSKALIDWRLLDTDLLEAANAIIGVRSINSAGLDFFVVLVRDPDGTPTVIDKHSLRANFSNSIFSDDSFGTLIRTANDTAHGGGSTTYALQFQAYATGTTTPVTNGAIRFSSIHTAVRVVETKR